MDKKEFLARWHDADADTKQKYLNLAIIIYGKKPKAPSKAEHMD
jgi:hypothetical protein